VVQKIEIESSTGGCTGGSGISSFTTTYWEAWQVQNGHIENALGGTGTDSFSAEPLSDHFGQIYQEGFAKFMPNYDAPLKWGTNTVPLAGGALWSTFEKPPGWSDSGAIHRSLKAESNCCGATRDTILTTVP
jgi:hypothetical protein